MLYPHEGWSVIDINKAVQEHSAIIQDLLGVHGLPGSESIGTCYGIGKVLALKVLKARKYRPMPHIEVIGCMIQTCI